MDKNLKYSGAAAAAAAVSSPSEEDSDHEDHIMDLSHISPSRPPMGRERLRRLSREEPYIHSVNEVPYAMTRLKGRRQSDPGRISLSPSRMKMKHPASIEGDISEDEEHGACHPRLLALRSTSMTVPEEFPDHEVLLRNNLLSNYHNRSRPRERLSPRRTLRSNSLPCSDLAVFEIGEAIGAVAITKPPPIAPIAEDSSEHLKLSPTGGGLHPPRRRRSVSIESTNLAAISEDNDSGELGSILTISRASRRLSTPLLNT